jgi:predicted branched-subunit amino acid permease
MKLDWRAFRRGFRAAIPLWLAAASVALAYVIAAREAGLSVLEIQLMSLTVYSASAQIAALQLLAAGAPALTILVTAGVMHLHFLLYGVSLARRMELSRLERMVSAYMLTDGAYVVTLAGGNESSFSFLFGAGLSLFLAWNGLTMLGVLLGNLIVIPASVQLDFAAPLTFFVLLVATVKTWPGCGVAVFSAAAAVLCHWMQFGSATVLIVGVAGALVGALPSQNQNVS